MKKILLVLLVLSGLGLQAQVYNGSGGSIITLTDTSRFNLNVSGLSPSTLNFNYGLEYVSISINHGTDRDIDCFLATPNGTLIELTTDNGGTGNNYTNTVFRNDASTAITSGSAPFTGNFRPEGELWRVNNGQNGNGTWQLRVIDDSNNGSTGSVVSWSLKFSNNPAKTFIFSESSLPIVVINTNGQNIPDDPKIIATMGVIDNGPGQRNHLSDPYNNYNGKIAIEVRGSSSQSFPKKSYGFETRDASGNIDNNVSLLGLPVEHDWILSANYTDKSFCRNVLAYQLSREMGHYASRTKYVELVLNGQYRGIYVLMEKLKRDNDRIDIAKLYRTETNYPDITGGYILKVDKTTGSGGAGWTSPYPPINHSNGQDTYIQYDYPDPDSIVNAQKAYIRAYVDSFENALAGPNFRDTLLGYSRFIGNGSWIDYFFSNEISKNVDGYRISSYLYKDKEKTLKAGPVWDYDIAWGNANYCGGDGTTGWAYLFPCTGDGYQVPFWWQRLLQDTNYANQVRCRWIENRKTVLSTAHIHSVIDSIATLLQESAGWNFTVWPILGTYVWPNPSPQPSTYAGEIQNLKNWISARLTWLDNNMPGKCNCSVSIAKVNVSCNTSCDGTAVALGVSPYQKSYTWSNTVENDTIQGLCPGTYKVTFEDAVGCVRTDSITITQPSVLNATATPQNASCSGTGCNGGATVSASGGTGPYTYLWSNGQNSATATSLCSGSYTVTVTDAKGCTRTATTTVNNPLAPSVTLATKTDISCFGQANGSATVQVTGGTAPYTYSWSPAGGTSATATGLAPGAYTCTVRDATGCETMLTVMINQPSQITVNATSTNVLCSGGATGSAQVTVSGGSGPYQYAWSPSGGNLSSAQNLSAGTYTVTVTDASSCTATRQVTISQPAQISVSATAQPALCSGTPTGSVNVTASGGTGQLQYNWSSGATTQNSSGLFAGTYTVTVTDANGCTRTGSATVLQPAALTVSTSTTPASCMSSSGTATALVTGGTQPYGYQWTPSGGTNATANSITSGNYTVRVTDANGCTSTSQAIVGSAGGISTSVVTQSDVSCAGGSDGSAIVTGVGGNPPYTYSWAHGPVTASISNLAAGTYVATVEDQHGCISVEQVSIGEPQPLSYSTSVTPVRCFGGSNGSISVDVSGGSPGYTYQWSPSVSASGSANNIHAGNYVVTVTDQENCTLVIPVQVSQPPAITLNAASTPATCALPLGTASVTPSGGSGGYTYQWFPSGDTTSTLDSLPSGTYLFTVTDSSGCNESGSVTVVDGPAPELSRGLITSVTCNGGNDGSAEVTVSGGTAPYFYSWFPSVATSSSAANLSSASYNVVVTDASGCVDSVWILIPEPAPLTALMIAENVTCHGDSDGSLLADAGGGVLPYEFSWSYDGINTALAENLPPGTYSVQITDSNNCVATFSATITEPQAITATSAFENVPCKGSCEGNASVTVSGGMPPYAYTWSNGETDSVAVNLCAGLSDVYVTDNNGCTYTEQFNIAEPADSLVVNLTMRASSCMTCADGSAAATASGGTPGYTYLWQPGGMSDSIASGLLPGTYTLCVTDLNQCQVCDSIVVPGGTTMIPEPEGNTAVYVYPNPAKESAVFVFGLKTSQLVSIDIFNATGQIVHGVFNGNLPAGEHLIRFDSRELVPGIYHYRFTSEQKLFTGTLVITR